MPPANTSQKQYLSTYLSLIRKSGSDDPDKIFDHIKQANVKDTTKLSYLNSMISLKKLDPSLVNGNLSSIKEYRDDLGTKIEQARETNNTNERQSKALEKVSLQNVKDFVKELNDNKHQSQKALENYILIKLMADAPVRNDLQEIAITRKKNDLKEPINSIFVPITKNKPAILSIKEYKTSNATNSNDITINLDNDISNDIRELIKDNRNYLFENNKGQPLSSSSFSHKMNNIFKKKFGINISSTILRKIYLTGKYGKVAKEMEQDAQILGHDITTQRKIYIKRKEGKIDA